MGKHLRALTLLIFSGILILGFTLKKEVTFSGKTMGTTWHVKVVTSWFRPVGGLQAKIDQRLAAVNRSMSTFMGDSEISRFNALQSRETPFRISEGFMRVMKVAEKIHSLTGGAWDATVNPLVNLWGFGSKSGERRLPEKDEIEKALADVGFSQIEIGEAVLVKRNPRSTLDLASIAKGFAVDEVARLLRENGTRNCLVEIGGEVFASGTRKDGKRWRVGVNRPRADAPAGAIYKVLGLSDMAMATSGDYRNFFESGGRRYSHVIDPRSGESVSNGVVSASIVAPSCTLADGLATAVMVMGHKKGVALIDRLENVEGLIVTVDENGALWDHPSRGFERP